MRAFITGVAGFLGSHLADRFQTGGHIVRGNDSLVGGAFANVPAGVVWSLADCCDTARLADEMAGCDLVIHCAATAHEGLSVFSPAFVTRNIFQASVSTISAAIQAEVKRFLFCSSMARYGAQQTPFCESMSPRPVDPYGIAKAASEEVLKALCETHGMEWNIAVPHNIVGPRQCYTDPYRNVVSIMANRNLRGLPAIIYGDGEQRRCFSYIDDCLDCLERMAMDPVILSETINIGPDEGTVTINELAVIVAEATSFAGEPIHMPDRPREVKDAMCSSDKARALLDYETKTDLRTAVKKTVEWIRQAGPAPFDYDRLPIEIMNDRTPRTWADRLM